MQTPYTGDYHKALRDGARRSAEVVVPLVLALARPRSVVDVGCGLGTWLAVFAEHGVEDVRGVDGAYVERSALEIPPGSFIAWDLEQPLRLGRTFDLVVSLEVAEHLPARCAETFVASLAGLGPLVLFSAAAPHQGGCGHVNEQWPDYWARLFTGHGLVPVVCLRRAIWNDERVDWWYAQNVLLFAAPALLARCPALAAERERTGLVPLALVHPKRYLEWIEWGLAQCAARAGGGRMSERLRVVVLGYIIRGPLGGLAWHHLQYVLGLARLGHDVLFVEDSDDYPACYDPSRGVVDTNPTYGLGFARRLFEQVGLGERWAYHDAHARRWHGPCADSILGLLRGADLLLNLSGVNPLRPWLLEVPARALVDTDPAFTQVRHLTDPAARALALQHTTFFSFGENVGTGVSAIPDDGLPWMPTRQPVVLDAWGVSPGPAGGPFTTVMQWDSYPAREHQGVRYGTKADSFGPYLDLPARAGRIFELALGSASAPRALLRERGWALRDPLEVTRDCWTYQTYLAQSRAEFGVAKHGYVVSSSGWFSERSAGYLAAGRPVITQDTGFGSVLPTGEGLFAFNTLEDILSAFEAVRSDPARQRRAARAIAEEYFRAETVLARLLDDLGS
jgi:SAM-dependent methyltransferase